MGMFSFLFKSKDEKEIELLVKEKKFWRYGKEKNIR